MPRRDAGGRRGLAAGRTPISGFKPQMEGLETHEFLAFFEGVEYGSWITGRNFASGALIESFPYAIEWILRNLLAIQTAEINTTSFDTADTILGTDWKIIGSIIDLRSARDHIENILSQCKCRLFRDEDGKYAISVNQGTYPELLSNGILETLDAGADTFEDWTDNGGGDIDDETTIVKSGNHSAKLTKTAGGNAWLTQDITVVASTDYVLSFDSRGDGSDAGAYRIYDNDAPGDIVAQTTTGNTSTSWEKFVKKFTTPVGCTSVKIYLISNPSTQDAVAYFDNISVKKAPVTDYDDYKFDKDDNIFNLKVRRTLLDGITNNVRVKYQKNAANGNYLSETWISCKKEHSGSLLNEALDDSETAIDVDDGTDFNTTTRKNILFDDEMGIVTGIAANTLTVTRGAYGSKARAHDDDTIVYVVLVDSSDADSDREWQAIETVYKYRSFRERAVEADFIADDAVAINLRNHIFDYYYKPRWIVEFETGLNASDLKITSIIEFDDTVMDDWLKLGGESWINVKFEVTSLQRVDTMRYRVRAIEI
jgi:hypothetical protein